MRTYERTHPWLKFQLNLGPIPHDIWITLGECESKCTELSAAPLAPQLGSHLQELYLARGIASNAGLAGNTLTDEEVWAEISGGVGRPHADDPRRQEVLNLLAAFNEMVDESSLGAGLGLTPERICRINAVVLEGLPRLDGDSVPGQFRTRPSAVGEYSGAPAEDCEVLVTRLCRWLDHQPRIEGGHLIVGAILNAIIGHLYLVWIRPFADGNGRTARLLEAEILLRNGAPLAATHLLTTHYCRTKASYLAHLSRASKSGGFLMPFLRYAIDGLRNGLDEQLEDVRRAQVETAWRQHLDDILSRSAEPAAQRSKTLLNAILDTGQEFVPIDRLPTVDSGSGELRREINGLVGIDLLEQHGDTVRLKPDVLLSFRPLRPADQGSSGSGQSQPPASDLPSSRATPHGTKH